MMERPPSNTPTPTTSSSSPSAADLLCTTEKKTSSSDSERDVHVERSNSNDMTPELKQPQETATKQSSSSTRSTSATSTSSKEEQESGLLREESLEESGGGSARMMTSAVSSDASSLTVVRPSPAATATVSTSTNITTTTAAASGLLLEKPLEESGGGSARMMTSVSSASSLTAVRPSAAAAAAAASSSFSPYASAKVLKGEIHNVLTILRQDPRYVSDTRFVEELVMTDESQCHPLAHQLQHVSRLLCDKGYSQDNLEQLLQPFCDAVRLRDIRASVTGVALQALQKFLLYGLITSSTTLSMIATCLIQCCFEEEQDSRQYKRHSSRAAASFAQQEEEQVVLQLVHVAALVVQCALQPQQSQSLQNSTNCHVMLMLPAHLMTGLLETCLHVTKAPNASPLLQHAATTACSQIVLHVFGTSTTTASSQDDCSLVPVRLDIWSKLVLLLHTTSDNTIDNSHHHHHHHDNSHCVTTSLTLINMALETCRVVSKAEIAVLQNDVCKYLLLTTSTLSSSQNSSSNNNYNILTLQLRVIFNLFCTIRNPLKVALEVFLQTVHLRLLLLPEMQSQPQVTEIVLESLLEFCQEDNLMQDIYRNYDCDVACSNLYEAIVAALGQVALPTGCSGPTTTVEATTTTTNGSINGMTTSTTTPSTSTSNGSNTNEDKGNMPGGGSLDLKNNRQTATNHRHRPPTPTTTTEHHEAQQSQPTSLSAHLQQQGSTVDTTTTSAPPLTHLNRLALEGLLTILDSIAVRCCESSSTTNNTIPSSPPSNMSVTTSATDTATAEEEMTVSLSNALGYVSQVSDDELRERKLRKHSMAKVAHAFNANPMGTEWMDLAVAEGLLNESNAKDVAKLFCTAPGLDKVKLGLYLSKGPDQDYPFQADVRSHFVALFDFRELSFASALRKFLSKFRLPGEAQCIDRLMEAFSKEYYEQQKEATFFKNADAVYVLSFSTIMLNTDLHNPTIKQESRMTLRQFLRNNRGLNGGDDLPEDFLTELYEQIKDKQIQVRREMGEVMKKHDNADFRTAWEGVLSKTGEVATPFFGPAGETRRAGIKAGVHDMDMFIVLSKWLLPCLSGVFLRSWDDTLVVKVLKGMQEMAMVAAYFDMDSIINDIVQSLLPMGRDYVMGCVALDYAVVQDNDASVVSNGPTVTSTESVEDDEHTTYEPELPIPYGLLCSSRNKNGGEVDLYGSASHRGILALDCGFVLLRQYGARVSSAWPTFIECLCALRDAHALPAGLADLDDFANSSGQVLPLSSYAKTSQRRLDDYYRSKADGDDNKKKSWFGSFFRKSSQETEDDFVEDSAVPHKKELSAYSKALLGIAEAADVENVVQMGSTKLPTAEDTIRSLLDAVDEYPYDNDPVLEQHAIFSLELATRALFSNRDRAPELFDLFLHKFESILLRVSDKNIQAPFVLERVVVTVLRSCIHLYDLAELRPHLRASLQLLFMALPRSFIREIADRIACGLAIILRASFYFFETPNEWTFMGDTLDMLAQYSTSRVFVFDGIASTVEYAIPSFEEPEESNTEENGERPQLSIEACNTLSRILIRFVLGFYQGDMSLVVPAMLCLEKIYRSKTTLLLKKEGHEDSSTLDPISAAPDKEMWQNVAVAVYSVCRSPDPDVSRHGVECYQRLVLKTSIDQIPDDNWIAILYLMVNKQPSLSADESRGNTFSILGQLLSRILPELSHRPENHDDLVDLINLTASLAEENLRQGRRGSVSPLFEKTLQTVTYLSNHMMTDEWKGETEFSTWASETLLSELERVGAAGASLKNQEAIKAKREENTEKGGPDP